MASFTEKVTILIEAKVDSAKSGMKDFKQSVSDAEGATGKFKAAAGGLGDVVSSAASSLLSPAGLAAGATAVGAAAAKAVGAFTELGLTIGKVSDATGLSAEEASRWVEVADDAGVSSEAFTKNVGFLEKALGKNQAALEAYGVEVVKNADGTTNMNETTLNAVDAINAIEDPVKRAAAGTAIFGKGWKDMSELIARGSGTLREDLASVQPSKVFSGKDIKSARDVRDGMDAIHDAVDGLALTLGRSLAPAVAKLAPKFGELIAKAEPAMEQLGEGLAQVADAVGPVIDAIGELGDALHNLRLDQGGLSLIMGPLNALGVKLSDLSLGAIPAVSKAWDQMTTAELDGHAALQGTTERLAAVKKVTDESKAAVVDHTKETKAAEESNKDYADALKAVIDELEADKKAQDDLIDAQRAAADAGFAVTKATNDYHDSISTLNDRVKEAKGDQGKIKQAYDDTTQSAEELADAVVRQYEEQATANGTTLTAAQRTDVWNGQMLNAAATAKGPLRDAIIDHIAKVNEIPPEKVTDIQAAIDRGDIDEANRLLNEASATRTAAVKADLDNASAAATKRELDELSKDRTVNFHAGSVQIFGEGGTVGSEGGIGGEAGQEIIRLPDGRTFLIDGPTPLPQGTRVTSTRKTRSILQRRRPKMYANGTTSSAVPVSAGAMTFIFQQHGPVNGVADLDRHLERWSRQIAQKISAGRRN